MGRPTEHGEATSTALLAAAEALLVEGGFAAVSVRAVAARAGTTTRAVYALFGSKAGLIEALATKGYLYLAELVNAIPRTEQPTADLKAVAGAFRTFATGHPTMFRLTFERTRAEILSLSGVTEAAVASYDALLALIERAQRSGGVDPTLAPDQIAFMIHSVCQGLAGSELAAEPPPIGAGMWRELDHDDRAEAWGQVVGAVVDGLAPGRRPGDH